ncbi:MAG TPA: hypothetical protein VJY62_00555, partial [Bacteroidia bacterium]|nr:hypothetical protein [Bacteroidia bacterium]
FSCIFIGIIEFFAFLFSLFNYKFNATSSIWNIGWHTVIKQWWWNQGIGWHCIISLFFWLVILQLLKQRRRR